MSMGTAYVRAVWLRNEPTCSCGWTGKHRVFHGHAKLDALVHCADTGHTLVGLPLDAKAAVPASDVDP
jgi:hypothetical protein